MGAGLDFSTSSARPVPDGCKRRSASPASTPAASATARSRIDANGIFTTDGTLSTIEIVNILLGAGNDHLAIQSTLQPGGDFNPITGQRGELAHHGGITAVHGGGNALLKVDGHVRPRRADRRHDSATVAQITRNDGLSWARYGFVVGQQVTLPDGRSYTITGFATGPGNSGPATRCSSPAARSSRA